MRRAALLTTLVLGVAVVPVTNAATGVRTVDLWKAGATYDAASIQAYGDGTTRQRMDSPRLLGGILLTAVGTYTSREEEADPANNIRALLPMVTMDSGIPCDDPEDYTCEPVEPSLQCSYSDPRIGRTPRARPKGNGVWAKVKWSAVGCPSSAEDEPTWPLASGVTTYTVSNYKRIVTPAVYRTYVEGSDGYFNVCLTSEHISDIFQKNGVRQCKVLESARVDRVTFTLKQSTKITKREPAFVCPGRPAGLGCA